MNPGLHLKSTLLGNSVELPEEEPFVGTDKGPQSTAENRESQLYNPVSKFLNRHSYKRAFYFNTKIVKYHVFLTFAEGVFTTPSTIR